MINPATASSELDAWHAEATDAFERRDLRRYRGLFSPGLAYRMADGRVIGRDELMRDVRDQFVRLDRVRTSFVREEIEVDGDRATEILTQRATAGVTVFLVVHRTWEITRRGRYTWRRRDGRWTIEAVDILDEDVGLGRFSIGVRPPKVS